MYIIGSSFDILQIKKYSYFCENHNVKFYVIDSALVHRALNKLRIFQLVQINYKKVNILMYEIAKNIILFIGVKQPFVLILSGATIYYKGQHLVIYPIDNVNNFSVQKLFMSSNKLREVVYVMYSYDGYIVSGKLYKNKILIEHLNSNLNNFVMGDLQSTKNIFNNLNILIRKCSGSFLFEYCFSSYYLLVQRIINYDYNINYN